MHFFNILQQVEVSKPDSYNIVIIAAVLVVVILIIVLISLILNRRRVYRELNAKNSELEGKNRKLVEGISYAERIQTAILPTPDKTQEILDDHFVVFKPQQQVSGDFYWVEQRGAKRMFAVIDCTGHGVPGALMSIIGYDGLNRAIIDYELTRADKIVSALNEYFTETLKETGSIDVKDAMDVALCVLNKEKSQLEFTGARNALYLVRKSDKKLTVNQQETDPVLSSEDNYLFEVKPDRKSVEPSETAESFTNHHIQVSKGDTIYIFSDGFTDQFGGPDDKKFGFKRFRETIVSLQNFEMRAQRKKLEETLREWKMSNEQVDDITVIGVKI